MDGYSKAIFTVIAAALAIIAIKLTVSPSYAASANITRVAICDPQFTNNCASILRRNGEAGTDIYRLGIQS